MNEKRDPICRHFETCGGCSLQHLPPDDYLARKRGKVVEAFADQKIHIEVDAIIPSPIHSRRRVTFTAKREGGGIVLGFQQRRSHDLVDVVECPIALPQIVDTLPVLRDLAASLLHGIAAAQFMATACHNGLDLTINTTNEPSEEMTANVVRLLARSPFIRCALASDVIFEREKPLILFDGVPVVLPPAGFLQAVETAEDAMASLVCTHLKKSKNLADLFAGCGTFALRLARASKVHAVEQFKPALASLKSATGHEGLKRVTVEQRDLVELPLTVQELNAFDGICLDPPRAGAAAQCRELAKADIARIAYVSCNPETLAKDARILIAGGHVLKRVLPVDQFVFSHHVEAVALFEKSTKAKRSIFR